MFVLQKIVYLQLYKYIFLENEAVLSAVKMYLSTKNRVLFQVQSTKDFFSRQVLQCKYKYLSTSTTVLIFA